MKRYTAKIKAPIPRGLEKSSKKVQRLYRQQVVHLKQTLFFDFVKKHNITIKVLGKKGNIVFESGGADFKLLRSNLPTYVGELVEEIR